MSDTFPLGSIPPLSVWEGETLTFSVTTDLGPGGHLKVPHLWPGQIPPPLRRRDGWTLGGLCALGKAGG